MSDLAAIRKHIRDNPWEPGAYGKGVVTPTGTAYLYRTIAYDGLTYASDGWPEHADAVTALNADYPETGLVVIAPDGRFAFHYSGSVARGSTLADRVAAKHPALEHRQDAYYDIY